MVKCSNADIQHALLCYKYYHLLSLHFSWAKATEDTPARLCKYNQRKKSEPVSLKYRLFVVVVAFVFVNEFLGKMVLPVNELVLPVLTAGCCGFHAEAVQPHLLT